MTPSGVGLRGNTWKLLWGVFCYKPAGCSCSSSVWAACSRGIVRCDDCTSAGTCASARVSKRRNVPVALTRKAACQDAEVYISRSTQFILVVVCADLPNMAQATWGMRKKSILASMRMGAGLAMLKQQPGCQCFFRGPFWGTLSLRRIWAVHTGPCQILAQRVAGKQPKVRQHPLSRHKN